MVRTVITPNKPTISLEVPKDYIGKKVEVIVFAIDEVGEQQSVAVKQSFKGALHLTTEEYNDFQQHIANTRKEWE